VTTTELVAVEVVRALCGSVGLIAAVPLTTMLAALVATETPASHPTAGRSHPESEPTDPADIMAAAPQGRSGWALARGLGQDEARVVLDRVLDVHGQLSHAIVDVDGSGWLATEELPAEVRAAVGRLRRLAADAQRGASWYQRARTRGLVRLDLGQPEQLDLLRHYGPFATDLRVWAHGDPLPVVETADSFSDLPRFTYRLDPVEVDQVHAALADAGLPSTTLIPRRIRATRS
jgi:hypothetical protein